MMYKTLKGAIFTAVFAGIGAGVASAQAPMTELDGKAVIKNNYLAERYVGYLKQPDFVHDETSVRALVRTLLSNHTLDQDEKDLIRELQRTDVKTIKVRLIYTDYDVPTANTEGRRIFDLVTKPMNIDDYWDKTPEKLAQLAEYYALSNAHKVGIQRHIAGKLHPAWKKSNINNAYAPYRQNLGAIIQASKNANTPEDHVAVRVMMHGASEYLDDYLKDTMPDHIYSWVKPKT